MIKFTKQLVLFGFLLFVFGCAPFLTTYNSTTEIAVVDGVGEHFYKVKKYISYRNNDFIFFVDQKNCGNVDATLDIQISGSNELILRKFVDLRELTWAKVGNEMTCVPEGYFAAARNGDQRPLYFAVNKEDEVVEFTLKFVNNSAVPIRIAISSSY